MASECFHKTVKLQEWWLIWAENENHDKKLAVAGLTSGVQRAMRVFSSSPILRRHDVYTLETTDGICVELLGVINKARTEENGFPSEVVKCFFFGFPLHWEFCAEHYLAQGFASSNDNSREDSSLKGSTQIIEECNATNVGANVLDKDPALCPNREGSQTVVYINETGGEKDPGWKKTADIEMESKLKENEDIKEASKAEKKAHKDANLKGCSNANAHMIEMTDARATVSLANTDPELDQEHTACMILEGSTNSNEAIKNITMAPGAKDTAQRKIADNERESNLKEVAINEEASTAEEKTCNNVPSEDASSNGCSKASEKTNEMNNTKANASLEGCSTASELIDEMTNTEAYVSFANPGLELDQDHTACMILEGPKNSNEAVRNITRARGAKDTNQMKTAAAGKESMEITASEKAASKETSTPEKNTKRKLTYGSPVTLKADVITSFTSPGLSSVKRSRSGRLLLPTLEYWRNQTVVYDSDHQVIGVTDGISTPCGAEFTHEPKKSKGRPRSKKDPNDAREKLPHEPERSVGRPKRIRDPDAAREKLPHEPKRSVRRPKSIKDPDAAKATKKLPHEPKRSVGRPKRVKDPDSAKATKKLPHEPKRSVRRPKSIKDPDAAKEGIRSSRRR